MVFGYRESNGIVWCGLMSWLHGNRLSKLMGELYEVTEGRLPRWAYNAREWSGMLFKRIRLERDVKNIKDMIND